MSSISSLGVGSNLDLSGLLDKLSASESQPLVVLQKRQVSFTAKLSAYGTLQNALSNFQAAAKKLSDVTLFQGVKTTSSASDVLSASASTSGTMGDYAIEVTKLASAQSLATTGRASVTTAMGSGKVTIDFGNISAGTFVADSTRTARSITLDSSNNTLEGIRDAINKAALDTTTDLGVTASIVNDGGTSPYRLVLKSTQTGVASSMRIAVADPADPPTDPPPSDLISLQGLLNHNGLTGLEQTSAAANAALKVNGVSITSSTNTVKEAVQGVTLTLAKPGSSTLTLSRDEASVETAVNAFVTTYNALQSTATQLTKYDASKKSGAALVGDSTLRTIQTSIRSALNTPQTGSLTMLSNVGVSFQKDGTLALDASKFKTAFADKRDAVEKLFAGTAGGTTGFGTQLTALVDTFTGTDGKLSSATTGVKSTLKSLDTQYASMQVSVDAKVARYRAQFTQLDLIMSKMSSTTSYLTQQFTSMNASKN